MIYSFIFLVLSVFLVATLALDIEAMGKDKATATKSTQDKTRTILNYIFLALSSVSIVVILTKMTLMSVYGYTMFTKPAAAPAAPAVPAVDPEVEWWKKGKCSDLHKRNAPGVPEARRRLARARLRALDARRRGGVR